jgi:MFS family permease
MLVAITGFYFNSLPIVMTAVLLMGLQSTMFSPAKYGLIRDIRGKEGISFGTGMMEMLTFVGVLLGTMLAGVLGDYLLKDYNILVLSVILLSVAFLGWIMAKMIKADESPVMENTNDTLNPVLFIYKQWRISKLYPGVNNAIFGLSLFWLIGATIQLDITDHARYILHENNKMTGLIMSVAAIGIAAGAILTGWLSGKRVHLGYVVIGSLGLSLSMFAIVVINPPTNLFMILVFIAAFFAGFFKIPLNSYVQDAVKGRKLGDILGYLNVMVFIFILLSAAVYALFNFFTAEEVMFEGHPKEVVDTLMVFGFIGLVSLATGVYFYFSVDGAKEDFHEILKGNLRRDPVLE